MIFYHVYIMNLIFTLNEYSKGKVSRAGSVALVALKWKAVDETPPELFSRRRRWQGLIQRFLGWIEQTLYSFNPLNLPASPCHDSEQTRAESCPVLNSPGKQTQAGNQIQHPRLFTLYVCGL